MLTARRQPQPTARKLPSFPGGRLFTPESRAHRLLVRGVAILALAASIAYLTWRLFYTIDLSVAWIAVPFFALEAHALMSLALFTFSLWDIDSLRPARSVTSTTARIAVFIPTYNETADVLLPTIAAALALQPAHDTYVLDDGNRAGIRKLAADLGAHYITRPDNTHAKAGNINHALSLVRADLVAILDADHVARPDFLRNTLGYFDDPRVALVQTPQDFYNLDSFEHESGDPGTDASAEKDRYHEEGLFYRVIQPGKNRWGAAFWCGTGAVVRTAALRDVGGLATETITEDIHTTVRLHRRGWKTLYHNEVLARGLAARTAAEFQLQRYRWGTGAMQLLRKENPLTVSGLRLGQRLAYAATLLGWFEAWRSLGYLLVPVLVLLTGAIPVRSAPEVFLPAFLTVFILQQLALRLLSRGYHRLVLPIVFDLVRMTPNLLATLNLVAGGRRKFRVTPKGRDEERRRVRAPTLLIAILLLSVSAAAWFGMTEAGWIGPEYEVQWLAFGAMFWLTFNSLLVTAAIARVRSLRFGAERRASVRFDTGIEGSLDLVPCAVLDISLSGALVRLPAMGSLETNGHSRMQMLTIKLGDVTYDLKAVQRSRRLLKRGQMLCGLEFVAGQEHERAKLALALFNAQIVPEIVSVSRPLHSAGETARLAHAVTSPSD